MIRPISSVDGFCPAFRGIIKDTPILHKALRHFNQQEKDEFIRLRKQALNVDDGRVFGFYMGHKSLEFDKVKRAYQSELNYIGMYEEGKPRKEISEEVVSMRIADETLVDEGAYARAILKPLREIYNNN